MCLANVSFPNPNEIITFYADNLSERINSFVESIALNAPTHYIVVNQIYMHWVSTVTLSSAICKSYFNQIPQSGTKDSPPVWHQQMKWTEIRMEY